MCQSVSSVVLLFIVSALSGSYGVIFQDTRLYEGSPCELSGGRPGVCAINCSSPVNQLKICGFKGSDVLTCCPGSAHYPILEKVCSDRTAFISRANRRYYGLRFETLSELVKIWKPRNEASLQPIHPVAFNEHPHMAALGINRGENVIEWFCGGSLIHELFVLTAAHCITNIGTPNVVRIGETDLMLLMQQFSSSGTQFKVLSTYIHEGYQPPLYYNDIALLKIKKELVLGYRAHPLPACIWTSGTLPTTTLLTMGYGAPAFSQEHTNKLYQGNLTIVEREECSRSYNEFPDLPKGIVDSQICAHDPQGVLDTCEGDSGGPLQFNANDDFKTPYLVGITSFGVLCLDGNPGVYTKVAAYLEWIEGTIRNSTSA